jgi:hypothetical protein
MKNEAHPTAIPLFTPITVSTTIFFMFNYFYGSEGSVQCLEPLCSEQVVLVHFSHFIFCLMDDKSKLVPHDQQPNLRRQSSIAGQGCQNENSAPTVPIGSWGELNSALPDVSGDGAAMQDESSEGYVSESSCGEEEGDESSGDELLRERGLTGPQACATLQGEVDRLCERLSKLWGDLGKAGDSYEGFEIFDQIEATENQVHTLLRRIQRYRKYR